MSEQEVIHSCKARTVRQEMPGYPGAGPGYPAAGRGPRPGQGPGLRRLRHGHQFRPRLDRSDPMPLGHEISAEVVEVGKNVATVKAGRQGDRRGLHHVRRMRGLQERPAAVLPHHVQHGRPARHGRVHVGPLQQPVKYEGLDHVAACLTEPLAVSLTAVLNAQIPLGGSVAVLGPGPLGLMAARVARLRGAGYVCSSPACRPTIRASGPGWSWPPSFGCDDFIEIGKQDVEAEVKKKFPKGVDRVIVSSPPESLCRRLEDHQVRRHHHLLRPAFRRPRARCRSDINDLIFRKISLVPTFAEPAINFPVPTGCCAKDWSMPGAGDATPSGSAQARTRHGRRSSTARSRSSRR